MTRLVILGAGTFAIEVLEAAELAGGHEPVGFVVSGAEWIAHPTHAGLPVVSMDAMTWTPAEIVAIGGIVSTARRRFIEAIGARGFGFATVAHPSATTSPRATVGPGCFIGAQVIVASNARIGGHVLLNRGASVGHDVAIESFTTIGPGVTIAGSVSIGAGVYLGVGAVIRDRVSIGEGAVVAAGAVVVKSVPARTLVSGCPAVVVRENVTAL